MAFDLSHGQWVLFVVLLTIVTVVIGWVGMIMLVRPNMEPKVVRRFGFGLVVYALVLAMLVWLAVGATFSAMG